MKREDNLFFFFFTFLNGNFYFIKKNGDTTSAAGRRREVWQETGISQAVVSLKQKANAEWEDIDKPIVEILSHQLLCLHPRIWGKDMGKE